MKGLTKILEEAIGQSSTADRKDLLNFVRTKSAEFEAVPDATAVEVILATAVSTASITQQGKDILAAAVQNFSAIRSPTIRESNQLASPPAADSADPAWTSARGVGTVILTASSYTAGITAGLLWLLILYLLATWTAVGSLSSIQFREDIYQKYNTTLNQIVELKNLKIEANQYRDKMINEVTDWERDLTGIAIALKVQPDINSLDAMKKECSAGAPATSEPCRRLDKVLTDYLPYLANKKSKEDTYQKALDAFKNKNRDPEGKPVPASKSDDLLARIEFMENFGYWPMLVMPDQVLTLLLAIAMGVLGSTITMTWTFLAEKPNPPLRWYLLRPFVGALSALVIFIFAKAGQMTLTTDAANATLSPFLLSLLGIAGGLLSDRAYAQMSSVSGRVLGEVGAEQERWSSHLEEELNKKQMTSDQLATALNLDKQRIAAIITGHQMATMQEQQRISDRLGIAPRLLFTDIPP